MKDKIDSIFYDLKHELITEKQAQQQVLDLFAVSNAKRTCFFCDTELAEWQPESDNVCNLCADKIKAEKHGC